MRTLLMVLCTLTLILGCSIDEDLINDPPARESPTPVVSGQYVGTWASAQFARNGALEAALAQDGDRLSGQMVFGNSPCVLSGSVEGDLDVEQFDARITTREGTRIDTGGIVHGTGHQLDGNYRVRNGACTGDTGTFTMNRSQSGSEDDDDDDGPRPPPDDDPVPPPDDDECCKICIGGQACGDSCIERTDICHQLPGCACQG